MYTVSNPWVSYVTRSYQQIKASLLQKLVAKAPEITDHSESNILVILISMFSGAFEMLGYYVDNAAREAFILSIRRYSSMVQAVRILDYRIKASNPSTVDITFTFNNPIPLNGSGFNYQLPIGIEVQDSNNVKFISQNTVPLSIEAGSKTITIPFIQEVTLINQNLGTSDGTTLNQTFDLPSGYVDGSLVLVIGGVSYDLVETFAYSLPLSKHYIVEVTEAGIAQIVLGDNINAIIPPASSSIIATFKTTLGSAGNLSAQTITTLNTSLSSYLPGGTTITISNQQSSTGGSDYEGLETIRKKAPLSIRTLYRAVTPQDYIDITVQYPGVALADINYDCGKSIDIFIVPINGGIAQTGLLNSVLNHLNKYKMVGTFPIVRPAGTTNIVLSIDVTLKFRADPVYSLALLNEATKSFFALSNQNINAAVHISVLEALYQAISYVDFLNITKLTTRPYARPIINLSILPLITQSSLNWVATIKPACVTESDWVVTYLYDMALYPSGKFIVIRNGNYDGEVLPNTTYISPSGDIDMVFNIAAVTDYINQQSWEFTTYPYNQDIELNDFTVPAVNIQSSGAMPDVIFNIIQTVNP